MMKKFLLLLMMGLKSIGAFAHDALIDNIYYTFSGDEATVSHSSYRNYNCYSGRVVIPESVTYDGKTYRVTCIGEAAFFSCSELISVTIPESVTTISRSAFSNSEHLSSFTIPESVMTIGEGAFGYCTGIKSIIIPKNVVSIGERTFSGCRSLTSIVVATDNGIFDSRNNCNAIIETSTNTLISGCKNTIIPNTVTSIGSHAFYSCSGLTSATIPNSVTSIGYYAFYSCSSLSSIAIPNSVTSIGISAFEDCKSLTSITIPNSIKRINMGVFQGCI